jgi:hypothetical protein
MLLDYRNHTKMSMIQKMASIVAKLNQSVKWLMLAM